MDVKDALSSDDDTSSSEEGDHMDVVVDIIDVNSSGAIPRVGVRRKLFIDNEVNPSEAASSTNPISTKLDLGHGRNTRPHVEVVRPNHSTSDEKTALNRLTNLLLLLVHVH